jgi:MHS family proline/betaine transporter-like MFS transporter
MFKAHNAFLSWLSQALMCMGMGLINGVLPACFINLFPPQLRCTGVSVAHNLSMALFGGTAPLMATAILHGTGDIASPSALMIIACALSICGALLVHRAQRLQHPA